MTSDIPETVRIHAKPRLQAFREPQPTTALGTPCCADPVLSLDPNEQSPAAHFEPLAASEADDTWSGDNPLGRIGRQPISPAMAGAVAGGRPALPEEDALQFAAMASALRELSKSVVRQAARGEPNVFVDNSRKAQGRHLDMLSGLPVTGHTANPFALADRGVASNWTRLRANESADELLADLVRRRDACLVQCENRLEADRVVKAYLAEPGKLDNVLALAALIARLGGFQVAGEILVACAILPHASAKGMLAFIECLVLAGEYEAAIENLECMELSLAVTELNARICLLDFDAEGAADIAEGCAPARGVLAMAQFDLGETGALDEMISTCTQVYERVGASAELVAWVALCCAWKWDTRNTLVWLDRIRRPDGTRDVTVLCKVRQSPFMRRLAGEASYERFWESLKLGSDELADALRSTMQSLDEAGFRMRRVDTGQNRR